MDQQQLPYLFQVGDVCVNRYTFTSTKSLAVQKLQIRKFVNNNAIVHHTHAPTGMVLAVNLLLLNTIDLEGFLRPSPYHKGKRHSDGQVDGAAEKKTRKE